MKKAVRVIMICLSCLVLISWDKASKNMAKEHLEHKAPISFVHNAFRLEYAENTGAAMSLGDTLPDRVSLWLLGIVPLAALAVLFVYLIKTSKQHSIASVAAGIFMLCGGIGNISDRIINKRHVTDFMNVGIDGIRSGIFNFADVYITAGVILFIVAGLNANCKRTV